MTMYRNPVIHGQSGHINCQLNSMNHMLALVKLDYDKKCDRLTTDLKAHKGSHSCSYNFTTAK